MNLKSCAILCCLLAEFSLVWADDGKVAAASEDSCYRKPSGCTHNGIFIPEGQTRTLAPCQYGTCKRGKVSISIADCPPPQDGCRYESTMEECCKKICVKGCTYNGIFIPEGQTKTVAPCQYGTCDCGKVHVAIADCPPPQDGCRYESTMEECCKKICVKGCTYNGIFIPEGQTKTVAPCQYGTCDRGKVHVAIADCPRPQDGCRYESTMEECCKKICVKGCTYNGIFIPEGQTKTVAPCQYGTCDCGKVHVAIADCPPPQDGCRYESTMEECCKKICVKGCTYNGIFIPEGQTKTVAPCQYGTCDCGKVHVAIADCPRPQDGCRYESTMEECCKKICVKGCTYNGIFIPEGQTKTVAPCEFASCINGQVALAVADCLAPRKGCRIESTIEECCKQICDGPFTVPVVEPVPAR